MFGAGVLGLCTRCSSLKNSIVYCEVEGGGVNVPSRIVLLNGVFPIPRRDRRGFLIHGVLFVWEYFFLTDSMHTRSSSSLSDIFFRWPL